jgi:hypothetical protein
MYDECADDIVGVERGCTRSRATTCPLHLHPNSSSFTLLSKNGREQCKHWIIDTKMK